MVVIASKQSVNVRYTFWDTRYADSNALKTASEKQNAPKTIFCENLR